ncbi:hypothetical protein [Sphingosinicella sp. BN140058]|nr:hypothetical protein [Sphingosinicella sp. BN140058]
MNIDLAADLVDAVDRIRGKHRRGVAIDALLSVALGICTLEEAMQRMH